MTDSRRGFLSKLGIGSIIFTASGIFKVTKNSELVQNISSTGNTESLAVTKLSDTELTNIAGSILDALDGHNTNPVIYEAVRAHLIKDTIYDLTDRCAVCDTKIPPGPTCCSPECDKKYEEFQKIPSLKKNG